MAEVPGPAAGGGLGAAGLLRASDASKSALQKLTISKLGLPVLDSVEVVYNMSKASGYARGGQAEVYFTRWQEYAGHSTGFIPVDDSVAIKLIRSHSGGGQFEPPKGRLEMNIADRMAKNALRIELHLLALLHAGGCGTRIVQPIAVFNYPGEWLDDQERRARRWWQPANGYVMKAYPLGSLTKLLQDICYRRVPESVGQRFLNLRTMSAEYAALLGELHKIHTLPGVRMMIQDLTPGNLLVDDGPEGMRLMLSDPAMAQPIKLLQQVGRRSALCGTWLWGSMRVRRHQFDPTADLYSLSFSFAEAWLVAEGAVESPGDLIVLINADLDKAQGVQFMRHLVWEVLRLHHQGTINIKPRVQRHLPVSWLGAWLLLLGFRDYACEQHMRQGLPCLRPSEEAVLEAAQLWARIAAAAEELPPGLAEEQALSPSCAGLVDDMAHLLQQLVDLSHLSDAGEQEDPALAWCAANFMEQAHPLVAAMKARGAKGVGRPQPPRNYEIEIGDWWDVIGAAQRGVLHAATPADFARQQREFRDQLREGKKAARALRELGQWYKGLQHKVAEGTIPIDLYNQLCPPSSCYLALVQAAEAAATTNPATGQAALPATGAAPPATSLGRTVATPGPSQAAGDACAASPLPQPGNPRRPHIAHNPSVAAASTVALLDAVAHEAASQLAVTGRKRKGSVVDAPASSACLDRELMELLEATYDGEFDTADQQQQAALLPSAGIPPAPLSPSSGTSAVPPLSASAQAMEQFGAPALWPGLQGTVAAAAAASALAAGTQPSKLPSSSAGPHGSAPGAAPSPFSFRATLPGAAPAPQVDSVFPSASTAGYSLPGGQAAAPPRGSSWAPAPAAGALPASGSLGAAAFAGWPGGSLPPWCCQPAGGSSATGLQAHSCSAPVPGLPSPALSAPFWHQPADPTAAVPLVGGPPAIGQTPLHAASARTAAPETAQTGNKKPGVNERRTQAYAEALEQLLDLARAPAPNDAFAPLRTQEQVLAFLRWWAADGVQPRIPGMQFGNTHKSQFVLAVMDKATPGHGLTAQSRGGTWGQRLGLVKNAAASFLRKLEQQ